MREAPLSPGFKQAILRRPVLHAVLLGHFGLRPGCHQETSSSIYSQWKQDRRAFGDVKTGVMNQRHTEQLMVVEDQSWNTYRIL
jgi:hypothetical protein